MRRIRALFFKQSGKYYTQEIIKVSDNIEVWEICDIFKDRSLYPRYGDMPYVMIDAADPNDNKIYPCLIIRGGNS